MRAVDQCKPYLIVSLLHTNDCVCTIVVCSRDSDQHDVQLYSCQQLTSSLFQSILTALAESSTEVHYVIVATYWLINSIGALTHCSTGGVTWTNHSYRAVCERQREG